MAPDERTVHKPLTRLIRRQISRLRCARNDKEEREAAFGKSLNSRYPIEIKQKEHVGGPDIDAFEAMMIREERAKGFFVAFGYLEDALREVGAFFRKTGKSIIALTVRDILDEEIASKLA